MQQSDDLGFTPVSSAPQQASGDDLGFTPVAKSAADPFNIDMSKVAGAAPGTPSPAAVGRVPQPNMKPAGLEEAVFPHQTQQQWGQQQRDEAAENQRGEAFLADPKNKQYNTPEMRDLMRQASDPTPQETLRNIDPVLGSWATGAYETGAGLKDFVKAGGNDGPSGEFFDTPALAKGANRTIQGAMTAGAPEFALAGLTSPLRTGAGYVAGLATGAGAEKVAKMAGASPETQELAHTAGFFVPAAAGTAAGLKAGTMQTPEGGRASGFSAFGGRVAGAVGTTPDEVGFTGKVGPYSADVRIPRKGGVNFSDQTPTALPGSGGAQPGSAIAPRPAPRPVDPLAKGAAYVQSVLSGTSPTAAAQQHGLNPMEQEQAHVAAFFMPQTMQSAVKASQPPAPPAPPPPPRAPQDPTTILRQQQNDAITSAAARAQGAQKAAEEMTGQLPPPPPKPQVPSPAGMDQGALTQQTVDHAVGVVRSLPPALQSRAMLETVDQTAKWVLDRKTFVGPSGQLENVTGQSPASQAQSAKTIAVNIVNGEMDRQKERAEAQQKLAEDQQKEVEKQRQDAAKQAQEYALTAQTERDEAGGTEKGAKMATTDDEPMPDTLAVRTARNSLKNLPWHATEEQMHQTVNRSAVTQATREKLVKQEILRRRNQEQETAHTVETGLAPAPGQDHRSLQSEVDQVKAGGKLYAHVPKGSPFKPADVEGLAKTSVEGAPNKAFNGTYYHSQDISGGEVRKAARDKVDAKAALTKLEEGWKAGGEEEKPETKPEPVKEETKEPEPETKPAEVETKEPEPVKPQEPEKELGPIKKGDAVEYTNAKGKKVSDTVAWTDGKVVRLAGGNGKTTIAVGKVSRVAEQPSPAVESEPAKPEALAPTEHVESPAEVKGQDGKTTSLLTPSRELPARYRLVEADNLKPSHDAQTFAKNTAYPDGLQERAYDTSKEAQNRVIQQAQNYDSRYTINTNPDAVNGPPVITPDGLVLGGNSRAMSTQRLYASDGSAYKKALKEQAAAYGFTPEQVEAMKNPVLVRQVESPASADEARRLGSELNKSMTGAMGVSERAVSAGKNIKPETLQRVAGMLQADDSTLRELMARHGGEVVKMLTDDGVITERERPQFVDASTGGLSEEGKTFVERALMGSVIDDPRLMDAAPKSVLQKLERSLGAIASFAARQDEWNLLPAIRAAVGELGTIQRNGNTLDDHLGQTSLFGGERNPLVDAVIRALDGKPTAVRKAFDDFARDSDQSMPGQARMFGEANAFDAFNSAFGSKLSEQEYHDGLEEAASQDPHPAAKTDAPGNQGILGSSDSIAPRSGEGSPEASQLDPRDAGSSDIQYRSGGIGAVPTKEVADYVAKAGPVVMKDLIEAATKVGTTAKGAGKELAATFFPTLLASDDALDIMGRATGEPAMQIFQATQLLKGIDKMFEAMPQDEWVEFVDRIQNPEHPEYRKQPTEDLQKAQDLLESVLQNQRKAEKIAVNLGRPKSEHVELTDKGDYFPNRWETAPGHAPKETDVDRVARIGKRPFAGKKAFLKQQTFTLKGGIEDGGVPMGNPVRMVVRRIEEGSKFVAAQHAMYALKGAGLVWFQKRGRPMPENAKKISDFDAIGKVWRPVETAEGGTVHTQTGDWVGDVDQIRLLENYLSRDRIRESNIGRTAMAIKTASTQMKLGFSPFHYGVEAFWNLATGINAGLDKFYNQGVRGLDAEKATEGLADIPKAVADVIGVIPKGGKMLKYASSPDEYLQTKEGEKWAQANPDHPHLQSLLFHAGLRWGLNQDFNQEGNLSHIADSFKEGHILHGVWQLGRWLPQMAVKPLFEHYIPRSKWVYGVKMLADKLDQYSQALADGDITEDKIARQVVSALENRFGEFNYGRLYWDNTVKSAIQLTFRAASWKYGTWSTAAGALKEQFSSEAFGSDGMLRKVAASEERSSGPAGKARRVTARLPQLGLNAGGLVSAALVMTILGTTLEKLLSGKYPWEWAQEDHKKNGLPYLGAMALECAHPRVGGADQYGNPTRFSFPTDFRDYEHAYLNPAGYAMGSLSDPVASGIRTLQNSDAFGNYVFNPQDPAWKQFQQGMAFNLKGNFEPISANNAVDKKGSQDTGSKVARWAGLTTGTPKAFDRSAALNHAIEAKGPGDKKTPEQVEAMEYAREHPTRQQILKAARDKNTPYLERIFKAAPEHGGISYADAKQIYDKYATPDERRMLAPIMRQKQTAMISATRKAAR